MIKQLISLYWILFCAITPYIICMIPVIPYIVFNVPNWLWLMLVSIPIGISTALKMWTSDYILKHL